MNRSKDMLEEELQRGIKALGDVEPNSDQYDAIVDSISILYKLKIEEAKSEIEYQKELVKQELDGAKSKDERKFQYIRTGVEIGLGLSSLMVSIWFAKKGFRFEETGTYTSQTFRNSLSRFKFK